MSHSHSSFVHEHPLQETAPETTGNTIRWARWYDSTVKLIAVGQDRSLRHKTADLAQFQPGESVLDVGCGTGDLTLVAKQRVGSTGQVVGIDAALEMIQVARQKAAKARAAVEFRTEAIEHLSFPDESFDVALSSLMMHHLPGDLKNTGLAEVRRVLKPGGRLLVVDFMPTDQKMSHWQAFLPLHRRMSQPSGFLFNLVSEAGFVNLQQGNVKFGTIGYVLGWKPK